MELWIGLDETKSRSDYWLCMSGWKGGYDKSILQACPCEMPFYAPATLSVNLWLIWSVQFPHEIRLGPVAYYSAPLTPHYDTRRTSLIGSGASMGVLILHHRDSLCPCWVSARTSVDRSSGLLVSKVCPGSHAPHNVCILEQVELLLLVVVVAERLYPEAGPLIQSTIILTVHSKLV